MEYQVFSKNKQPRSLARANTGIGLGLKSVPVSPNVAIDVPPLKLKKAPTLNLNAYLYIKPKNAEHFEISSERSGFYNGLNRTVSETNGP